MLEKALLGWVKIFYFDVVCVCVCEGGGGGRVILLGVGVT